MPSPAIGVCPTVKFKIYSGNTSAAAGGHYQVWHKHRFALKNNLSLCYIAYSKTHAGKDSQMVSKVQIIFWANELMRSGGGKTLRRNNGYCYDEGTAGSRSPFRTPGEALEPEDEEVYFRGKKRDPYCGSSEDA